MEDKLPTDFLDIIETNVAGLMYEERYLIVPHLALREQVCLVREPDNAVDPNAIKVVKQSGEHFGYIPRDLAALVAPYMDVDGRVLEATVSELISDASGSTFRVRICFRRPKDWGDINPISPFADLEYQYEDSGPFIYLLLNCSEAIFSEVKRNLVEDGMDYLKTGLCYRPAKNGRQYQWYIQIDRMSGTTHERIERFFRDHYDVVSDSERAKNLEDIKQKYHLEINDLQAQLEKVRQEAIAYEELAVEIDTESKQTKERFEQRILSLVGEIKYLQEQIEKIDNQIDNLTHENEILKYLLSLTDYELRSEDIPENVANALLNIVAESLTLSQSLKVIKEIFPYRIEILDTAFKSAEESKFFRYRKRAFELLWKLVTEYWNMVIRSGRDFDATKIFGDAYSPNESKNVHNDPERVRSRTFNYKGKK